MQKGASLLFLYFLLYVCNLAKKIDQILTTQMALIWQDTLETNTIALKYCMYLKQQVAIEN
ncbi:hypothetical protein A0J61_00864 [Choanephora cucurbitarum]|uniref:Uncharacterized protein n=1 Tax=Choanephora cucurbitarum TaxID=101091 RepID=A0A1C7NQA7_9FUNG|nr:hypothetical protein A0J61_00864 [Choanephora cucurbitarum]